MEQQRTLQDVRAKAREELEHLRAARSRERVAVKALKHVETLLSEETSPRRGLAEAQQVLATAIPGSPEHLFELQSSHSLPSIAAAGALVGPAAGPEYGASHYRRTLVGSSKLLSEGVQGMPLARGTGAPLVRVSGPLSMTSK